MAASLPWPLLEGMGDPGELLTLREIAKGLKLSTTFVWREIKADGGQLAGGDHPAQVTDGDRLADDTPAISIW